MLLKFCFLCVLAPLAVMHCTAGEVTLKGYKIPHQTLLIPDTFSIHMDPQLWTDPDKFNPERFLDGEGQLKKPPYFMPFCIGMSCHKFNKIRSTICHIMYSFNNFYVS